MTEKKEKKKPKEVEVPQKERYTVKMEVMVPVDLSFIVMAESDEEALQLITGRPLDSHRPTNPPKINISRARKIKAAVHKSNSGIITLTKKF